MTANTNTTTTTNTTFVATLGKIVLINFIAAAIGMLLFRHNDAHNFGTLPAAFVSIWMIETLDNWEDLMWINILGCHVYAAADDARALGGVSGMTLRPPLLSVSSGTATTRAGSRARARGRARRASAGSRPRTLCSWSRARRARGGRRG